MKVFHHNDLDGRCAAAIALRCNPEAECIEINYNQRFPIEDIKGGEMVYILDYSIEPEEMLGLLKKTTGVVWIDHHKTAIEKYAYFAKRIAGERCEKASGAWLTWEFFYPDVDVPEVVRLVDDWDMWTHEKNTNGYRTRQFVAAMKAHDTSPQGLIWEQVFPGVRLDVSDATISKLIEHGETMLYYEAIQNADYLKAFGHKFRFEDHTCYACNRGITNSELFDSIKDDDEITIFMPFVWDGFKWTVSLYSKTVDVAEIAKKYGGGGHTHAAGFVCDKLPWIS